jgi:hypothetical protein
MPTSRILPHVLLLLAGVAYADNTFRISGRVTDDASAPIANARVGLTLAGASEFIASTTTNQKGEFEFASVKVVDHELFLTKDGFLPLRTAIGKTPSQQTIVMQSSHLILLAMPVTLAYHPAATSTQLHLKELR